MPASTADALSRHGYAHRTKVLTGNDIAGLLRAIDEADIDRRRRGKTQFGARNLLTDPAILSLAYSATLQALIEPVLGPKARAVRATLFDKAPGANWPVAWHQDVTVALRARHDLEGWGPGSTKAGILHAHAPAGVLESMVAVRLHLDDCSADNGPLRVLPGTHCMGRLNRVRIAELRTEVDEVVCEAGAGDALLMRPLLLHASSPAGIPSHRRVLHLEFAAENLLPAPLAWAH